MQKYLSLNYRLIEEIELENFKFSFFLKFMRSEHSRDWITAAFRDERVKPRLNETHYMHTGLNTGLNTDTLIKSVSDNNHQGLSRS